LFIGCCARWGGIDITPLPAYLFFFFSFSFFPLDLHFGFPPAPIDTRLHSFALAIFYFIPSRGLTMKLLLLAPVVVLTALVGAQTTGDPDPVADFCGVGGSSSMHSRHSSVM